MEPAAERTSDAMRYLTFSSVFLLALGSYAVSPDGVSVASLQDCFAAAGRNNPAIARAAHRIEQTRGERISTRSRLLPHVNLFSAFEKTAPRDSLDDVDGTEEGTMDIALRQTLLEFGPRTEEEYARLKRQRNALYGSEETIVRVYSAIRETYFSLMITREQLVQHDSLLALYTDKLQQTRGRLQQGVGLKSAVLTARLNRLEERDRILGLTTDAHVLRARLEELTGVVLPEEFPDYIERYEELALPEDSCVERAMQRSTAVADAKADADDYLARVREQLWSFAPEMRLAAGIENKGARAGVALEGNHPDGVRQWRLGAEGAYELVQSDSVIGYPGLEPSPFDLDDPTIRYTAHLAVQLPLFKGLRRHGERIRVKARYEEARSEVIAKVRELEKEVRTAYRELELSRAKRDIQRERVAIANERYSLAETQHELGKMDDDGLDSFREQLFTAQDRYFSMQFQVLEAEEKLRALIRDFD